MLAGIRIAAVVSIGTATLAAFIGAGGLGEPIVTGLALNNTNLILQGAIPAALAGIVHGTGLRGDRAQTGSSSPQCRADRSPSRLENRITLQ